MSGAQRFLSAKEVAAMFGIAVSSVWRWTKQGVLPEPIKVGGRTRWLEAEILEVIKEAGASRGRETSRRDRKAATPTGMKKKKRRIRLSTPSTTSVGCEGSLEDSERDHGNLKEVSSDPAVSTDLTPSLEAEGSKSRAVYYEGTSQKENSTMKQKASSIGPKPTKEAPQKRRVRLSDGAWKAWRRKRRLEAARLTDAPPPRLGRLIPDLTIFNERQAAAYMDVRVRELAKLREENTGPRCKESGGEYYYRLGDLDAWLNDE